MATILIVEDEKNIQLLISERLKPYYTILLANVGKEALDILDSKHVDLVIADIMMPRLNGYQLVETLRQEDNMVPVLMLTAKQSFDDKRKGFSTGIDDYMTKPVNYEELLWRIQALLRRSKIASDKQIVINDVILDSSSYTLTKNNDITELPKKEFELLYKLLSYPGTIFTRNQLLDDIWGYDSESGEDTIKTHISRLRNKVKEYEEFEIVTIKGLGYKANITGGKSNES
ncbi:response regulator transcription factor [Anaeromicropila herbilytica]|uniref:Heme response regulator HssR n=1 Tax=Anaeromicropila herbilytica TaxID=2785025 RepID=A0A7R7EHM1_9FIRM|nr:response regulator transcription factor [Anaeromicropila herbilytica]BCN28888.1 DNA-binding response regulator [Anaeromicropila herbilytica]